MIATQFASDATRVAQAVRGYPAASADHAIAQVLLGQQSTNDWESLYANVIIKFGAEVIGNTQQHIIDRHKLTVRDSVEDDANDRLARLATTYVQRRVAVMLGNTVSLIKVGLNKPINIKAIKAAKPSAQPAVRHAHDDPESTNVDYPTDNQQQLGVYLSDVFDNLQDSGSDYLAENLVVYAGNIAANIGADALDVGLQKIWKAILDNRTRQDHADADGQAVGMDEAFVVGGEQLMFPLDDSLGASGGNLANCRCGSYFDLPNG